MAKIRRYKTLEIDRVDLVDRGANFDRKTGDGSHILIVKRDTTPPQEPTTMPAATEPQTADVQKMIADAVAKAQTDFEKRLADERAAIEKAANERAEKAETEKAALAARVEKAEKDAQAEIEKRETAECIDVVKGYAYLALDATKDGALLYRVGKALPAEDSARVREILAAANEQARVGKLFAERGSNGPAPADANGNPEQRLMAKAEELRKADTSLNGPDAVVKARQLFPDLRNEYDAWMRERAAGRAS